MRCLLPEGEKNYCLKVRSLPIHSSQIQGSSSVGPRCGHLLGTLAPHALLGLLVRATEAVGAPVLTGIQVKTHGRNLRKSRRKPGMRIKPGMVSMDPPVNTKEWFPFSFFTLSNSKATKVSKHIGTLTVSGWGRLLLPSGCPGRCRGVLGHDHGCLSMSPCDICPNPMRDGSRTSPLTPQQPPQLDGLWPGNRAV